MAVATFMSRILGLVREQVMAAYFGASGLTDAFLVAYRIPNLLRDLFAEGAFSSAFVPTFVERNGISRESARSLLWSLFIILLLITGISSLLIGIFSPELIALFAPTFKTDPEKFEITVTLTRIMAPFLMFVSIAALFMGALNSLKIFFVPALAPAFFNITMIVSMLVLPTILSERGIPLIYSLGIGVFVGGLVQALVQVPLIFKNALGPARPDRLLNNHSKKVIKLLGPGLVGFAATQVNLLVNTILASSAAIGAVSWLSYSFRLFQLPVGILSVSIGNTNLVHFSQNLKDGNRRAASEQLLTSYFLSWAVIFPAMITLLVLSEEIVMVIFERGKFTAEATVMTAKALRWYALGLPFYGIYKILVPSFYALDRQKIPVMTSILSIFVNIVFCVSLTPIYGFEILALGTSLSMLVSSSIQTWIIRKDLDLRLTQFFNMRWLKLLFVTICVGSSGYYFFSQIDFRSLNFITKCTVLAGQVTTLFMLYFILSMVLGERQALNFVLRKIRRKA